MSALLELGDLRLSIGGAPILRGVDLTVRSGERVALVGESGSGKSLTALAILGLLPEAAVTEGTLRFAGEDLLRASAARRRALRGGRIAMVFQDPLSALNPYLAAGRQVLEAVRRHGKLSRPGAHARVLELFAEVGLPDPSGVARAWPHQLSGGQRQRVMIAMAIAGEPELLVADEPTTALDVTVQAQILHLFRRLAEERGMALLLISHDLGVVAGVAERVGVMYAGRIVENAPATELFATPAHPYTRGLIGTLPRLGARRGEALSVIEGQTPDLAALPTGCPFQPRCPHRVDYCTKEDPPPRSPSDGRSVACHVEFGP